MITFNSSVYQEVQKLKFVKDTLYLIKEVSYLTQDSFGQDKVETTTTRFVVVEKEISHSGEIESPFSITLLYVTEEEDEKGFTEPQETILIVELKDIINLFNKD